jgi:DNA-binding MarR family transcriptional regulator
VAGKLQHEIRQTKAIKLLEEEAALNIVRTSDALMLKFSEVLKPHALSPTQYNVLRILRGAGKDGASCKDVGNRLIAHDPDITRLMDRLEKRGIIIRGRAKEDRRIVTHTLTPAGLDLVNQLDSPIEHMHRDSLRHIDPAHLKELIATLEQIRIAP